MKVVFLEFNVKKPQATLSLDREALSGFVTILENWRKKMLSYRSGKSAVLWGLLATYGRVSFWDNIYQVNSEERKQCSRHCFKLMIHGSTFVEQQKLRQLVERNRARLYFRSTTLHCSPYVWRCWLVLTLMISPRLRLGSKIDEWNRKGSGWNMPSKKQKCPL